MTRNSPIERMVLELARDIHDGKIVNEENRQMLYPEEVIEQMAWDNYEAIAAEQENTRSIEEGMVEDAIKYVKELFDDRPE